MNKTENFLYLEVYILVLITVLGAMREIPNYSYETWSFIGDMTHI